MGWNRASASRVPTGGPADIGSNVGDAGGAGSFLELAPWIEPPRGSVPLFLSGFAATVGVNNEQFPANCQQTMKGNQMGVIKGFTLFITSMLAATDVRWSLLVNGSPVNGLNPVTILPRVVTSISRPLSTLVFVPPLATVSVRILNVDGGSYNVGADLEGWAYQIVQAGKPGGHAAPPAEMLARQQVSARPTRVVRAKP